MTTKVSAKDAVALLKEMDVKSVSKDTPTDELSKKLKKFVKAAGDSLDVSDKHLSRVFKELAKAYEDGEAVKVFGAKTEANGKASKKSNDEDDENEDEEMEDEDQEEDEDQDDDQDEEKEKMKKKIGKKTGKSGGKRERSGESVSALVAKALGKATERKPVSLDDLAQINMDKTELRPGYPIRQKELPYLGGAHNRIIEYVYGLDADPLAGGKITT